MYKMASTQDTIDNLLSVSKTRVVFNWGQYSTKELGMFLEQGKDIIQNEENRIKYPKPNIFQKNYIDAQACLKEKLIKMNAKYEKLLKPPSFLI